MKMCAVKKTDKAKRGAQNVIRFSEPFEITGFWDHEKLNGLLSDEP